MAKLRIDRWLWCTRFFKTRSAAAQAVSGGHVRVDGQRVKPSREVGVGNVLNIHLRMLEYEITVAAIPVRRGPATEAANCYTESEASRQERETRINEYRANAQISAPATSGKPDKRTRRLMRNRVRSQE